VSIMRRSGSGKSTLLRQMGLIDRPTSGRIVFDEKMSLIYPKGERAKLRPAVTLGYVFQEYALLGELTTLQNVYLPGMMLNGTGTYKNHARELLELVGLGLRVKPSPEGTFRREQQRVAMPGRLINNPRVLLADEPCANLDTTFEQNGNGNTGQIKPGAQSNGGFVSHDPGRQKVCRYDYHSQRR